MRNFSMKKFGTPSGAGPGLEKEKVGFCGVGVPSGLVSALPDEGAFLPGWVRGPSPFVACDVVFSNPWTGPPLEEPCWVPPCVGWEDGAGEEELGVDWDPPCEGEEGAGCGVTGVGGSGTEGVGTGRLGVGGSVGVVTGPTVRAGAGLVPGVKAATSTPAPTSATISVTRLIVRTAGSGRARPAPPSKAKSPAPPP